MISGRFRTEMILTKAFFSPVSPLGETFPESESNLEIKAEINGGGQILHSPRALSSPKLRSAGSVCPRASSSADKRCFLPITFHVASAPKHTYWSRFSNSSIFLSAFEVIAFSVQ